MAFEPCAQSTWITFATSAFTPLTCTVFPNAFPSPTRSPETAVTPGTRARAFSEAGVKGVKPSGEVTA